MSLFTFSLAIPPPTCADTRKTSSLTIRECSIARGDHVIDRRNEVARDVSHELDGDALIDGGVVDENVLPSAIVVALRLPQVLEKR